MPRLQKKAGRFVRSLVIKLCIILVCAAALTAAFLYAWKEYNTRRFNALSAMVSSQLIRCAELTAVKAVYSDIVSLKKSEALGLAKSYAIIRYSGTIRAGIEDFSGASFTVSADRTSVRVQLPPVRILGNDISSMEVFDEYKNIFAPISSREIFEEINRAKNKIEQNFVVQGLIQDAELQSVLIVRRLLSAMGFKAVEVILAETRTETRETAQ
ncbi:DUF4230 domain-containing protein [Treponema sp. HNW]|uniref:DUF4230 domain-containing protein n=1 Tax=Treponema sp. HNW TaxID=3116654 RepID=UPI003D14006E